METLKPFAFMTSTSTAVPLPPEIKKQARRWLSGRFPRRS